MEAGLEILAAEGIDAVTMRAVAAKLGTGAASLYAHVRDKSELHQLMLDEVVAEVEVPAGRSRSLAGTAQTGLPELRTAR